MTKKFFALFLSLMMLIPVCFAQSAVPSVTIGSVIPSTGTVIIDPSAPSATPNPGLVIALKPVVQATVTPAPTASMVPGTTLMPDATATPEPSAEPAVSTMQQEILTQIADVVVNQNKPVVEYFAPEVVENVQQLLPPETDTATLQMDEFFQLHVEGYVPPAAAEEGEEVVRSNVQVAFQFTTEYKAEDKLVGMIGILPSDTKAISETLKRVGLEELGSTDENGVFWLAIKAEVINGVVVIHLPEGVLELAADFETVFALLASR